ncbi:hypothetical protein NQ176_g1700 [Zarea fungicola]|uniref:Uncharacterized protein n=1 Tax=Zarea fungicola TaxID=93591 RepID=A0ACC1NSY8_9HYPO|nr:hypothetical protein NQ176_g1700 [Lecanicillium fungicola]
MVLNINCTPSLSYLGLTRQGQTALLAIHSSYVDTALRLINRGGQQINLRNLVTGWRPLTLAVVRNQEEVVRALLIVMKAVDISDSEDSRYHGSPLTLAARSGQHRLVGMLLEVPSLDRRVTDRRLCTALDLAVLADGNVIIVETLVQTGFAVIPPQLCKALQSGNEAMLWHALHKEVHSILVKPSYRTQIQPSVIRRFYAQWKADIEG